MFAHFVNLLKPLANGKLALMLEVRCFNNSDRIIIVHYLDDIIGCFSRLQPLRSLLSQSLT